MKLLKRVVLPLLVVLAIVGGALRSQRQHAIAREIGYGRSVAGLAGYVGRRSRYVYYRRHRQHVGVRVPAPSVVAIPFLTARPSMPGSARGLSTGSVTGGHP